MKITKNQLRRIIREERARLLENKYDQLPQAGDPVEKARLKAQRDSARIPSEQAQDPIGMLEELNMNLQDIMANSRGPIYDDLNEQLILLENAIRALRKGAM